MTNEKKDPSSAEIYANTVTKATMTVDNGAITSAEVVFAPVPAPPLAETKRNLGDRLPSSTREVEKLIKEAAQCYIEATHPPDPAGFTNPRAEMEIGKFIEYIEQVEKAYNNGREEQITISPPGLAEPMSIVTAIRRLYYGGDCFTRLIPNANNQLALTDDRISTELFSYLEARADENSLGDNPSPHIRCAYQNGIKELIDVGHLFLGLDALMHPNSGIPYSTYGVRSIDLASWVGDLALAVVWAEKHEKNAKAPEGAIRIDVPPRELWREIELSQRNQRWEELKLWEKYYAVSTLEVDLRADADSFGLHKTWEKLKDNPVLKISDVLRAYYIGSADEEPGVKHRWKIFCDHSANGLAYTVKSRLPPQIEWQQETKDTIKKWVNRSNRMIDLSFFSPEWKYTPNVVEKFLKFVSEKLILENDF